MPENADRGGILVVEDEFLIASELAERLATFGFVQIHVAHNVTRGLAYLRDTPIQFAILDVNIGRDQVFPVARELATKSIPFIFCTGTPRSEMPLEWSSYPILPKPLNDVQIAKAMRDLLSPPEET